MNKICFVSIDVEHDVNTIKDKTFAGVEEIAETLNLFERLNIPATLFVTGDVLTRYAGKVKAWAKKYEIASHSWSHIYFNELSDVEKEDDIKKFLETYRKVLGGNPLGFRAPSHVIDEKTFEILEKYKFKYDSSVVPHYPPFKKYRGYTGQAPVLPYNVAGSDPVTLIEIPLAGQLFGIPLAGAWIRKLPIWLYRFLFILHKQEFITLSMHSWDILDARFAPKLVKILEILRNSGYVFKSGEQIAMEELA